jgi:anaerobic selenocysteine-containing dehydrogenase
MRPGGGWSAIWYTLNKSVEAATGPLDFWRRMASRNACKTCALGMGGQKGGMHNEAGHFPEFCKKSVQAMAADLQPPIDPMLFHTRTAAELSRSSPRQLENLGRLAYPLLRECGQPRFRRISWDEALDRAAAAMRAVSSIPPAAAAMKPRSSSNGSRESTGRITSTTAPTTATRPAARG